MPFPHPIVAGLALIMTDAQDNDVQECRDSCCRARHSLISFAKLQTVKISWHTPTSPNYVLAMRMKPCSALHQAWPAIVHEWLTTCREPRAPRKRPLNCTAGTLHWTVLLPSVSKEIARIECPFPTASQTPTDEAM